MFGFNGRMIAPRFADMRPGCIVAEEDGAALCALHMSTALEAIADQGPCFITCTDSDDYLAGVARDVMHACGVPYLVALTAAREFRGPRVSI